MIPKFTAPLTKAIRTTEGILVVLINIVLGVAATLDPSQMPPKVAAIVSGATAIALLIQRGLIKVVAAQHALGVEGPEKVDLIGALQQAVIDSHAANAQQINHIGKYFETAVGTLNANLEAHIEAIVKAIAEANAQGPGPVAEGQPFPPVARTEVSADLSTRQVASHLPSGGGEQ